MKSASYILTLVAAFSISCGETQATKIKQVAFACATVDIGQTIPEVGMTLFQDVMAIIQAGTDGWVDTLTTIGTKYGEDALACAAKAVYDALTAHPPGTMASAPSAATIRAKTFIETRSYRYQ